MRGVVLESAAAGPPQEIRVADFQQAPRRDRARSGAAWLAAVHVHRPVAGDRRALRDHAEADDVRARPAGWSPRPPPGCRSRSAASATGTTATPGSATPRSRSTPCSGWGSSRRPRSSAAGSGTGSTENVGRRRRGPLNIMYRVDGSSDLKEEALEHWSGYRGSRPVRIGNGASDQLQLDIYGEAMDSIYFADRHGLADRPPRAGRASGAPARLARRALGPARGGHLGDPRRPARTSPTAG